MPDGKKSRYIKVQDDDARCYSFDEAVVGQGASFCKTSFCFNLFQYPLSAPISAGAVAAAQQMLNLLSFDAGALKGSHGKNTSSNSRIF